MKQEVKIRQSHFFKTGDTITSLSNVTGTPKKVLNELQVSGYTNGDLLETTLTRNNETHRELLGLKLSAFSGETLHINRIRISLNYNDGAVDSKDKDLIDFYRNNVFDINQD